MTRSLRLALLAWTALVAGAGLAGAAEPGAAPSGAPEEGEEELARATFAGGCFWCVEEAFDGVEGVVRTTSGFTGGHVEDPSYAEVTQGGTGHLEAVRVAYDPEAVRYAELLEVFWHNVDPTDDGGQFCDRGASYETAIFYHDEEQRALAERSKRAIERRHGFEVVTPLRPAEVFYPAEGYHQDYHRKNPARYAFYKWNCGRKARLEELWGESAGKGS